MLGRNWRWTVWILASMLLGVPLASAKKKAVRQVVIQEVTRVEGRIQKPEVWYLLPRSNLNFEGLRVKEELVPKIEEATHGDPF